MQQGVGSRRRRGRWALVALAAALVATACGSDDESDTAANGGSSDTTAAQSETSADETGVLLLGERIGESAYRPEFDPIKATSRPVAHYAYFVYDTLLRENRDGSYAPALAESAEVVDESTITVVLKPNLTFQDGTPLDAEAVKFTILRNKDANNAAGMRTQPLQAVASIDVTSPTELTIHLSNPLAGSFYNLLAHNETMPVSPTAVNAGVDLSSEPVGAGPFRLVSQSDQSIELEKWPEYHDADEVHLAGIEIVNVASTEAMVNAFRTGVIDYYPRLTSTDLDQLEGAGVNTEMVAGARPPFDFLQLACDKNADLLGDVRVRQALIYATDREAINDVVYGGDGEIQTQFVGEDSPLYDPELADLYPYDVEKAKELLAEAGMSDLTLSTVQSPTSGTAERITQMLQQQWAEAGITLDLVATTDPVTDFYMEGKIASVLVPVQTWWIDGMSTFFGGVGPGSTCTPTDPEFNEALAAAQALDPSSEELPGLFQDMTAVLLEEARFLPLVISSRPLVWSERLGEVTFRPNQQGLLFPDFIGTYVAAE